MRRVLLGFWFMTCVACGGTMRGGSEEERISGSGGAPVGGGGPPAGSGGGATSPPSSAGGKGGAAAPHEGAARELLPGVETLAEVGETDDLTAAGGYLYWNEFDASGERFLRVAESGGSVESIIPDRRLRPFVVDGPWVYGLWDGLERIPAAGGAVEPFAATPTHCDLARLSGAELFCAHGLGVLHVDLSSRAASGIGLSQGYLAEGVAVDETAVYWIAAGELLRVPRAGGDTTVLVPRYVARGDLASDAENLYFSNDGQLHRLQKNGAVLDVLRPVRAARLVVWEGKLYWARLAELDRGAAVMASPLGTEGEDEIIAESEDAIGALAVTERGVFWTTRRPLTFGPNGESAPGGGTLHARYWK